MNAPVIAESVAQMSNGRFSFKSKFRIRVEYTPSLVKSTNDEMTTVVPMNASLDNPARIKNALRNAPCAPVSPPKNPLNAPPIGSLFLSNCRLLKNGIKSTTAKNSMSTATSNFKGNTSNVFPINW